jgi:hypothetical protein
MVGLSRRYVRRTQRILLNFEMIALLQSDTTWPCWTCRLRLACGDIYSERAVKNCYFQAVKKDLRGEAREKSASGGDVHRQYVNARRLSATKYMSL